MSSIELVNALNKEINFVEKWVSCASEETEGLEMVLRLLVVIRYLKVEMERWSH